MYYVGTSTIFNYNFILHTLSWGFSLLFIVLFFIIYKIKETSFSFSIETLKSIYDNMYDVIIGSLSNNGIVFISFLFFFWMFLFYFNLMGLLPFAFTIGSHFAVTICFSLIAWTGSLILILESEGPEYFEHFFIEAVNFYLAVFISLIELISYIFRAVSLALRLFANLVAGHVLLHLCGGLVISSMEWDNPFNLLFVVQTLILLFIFTFLFSFELVISFVQSYVFLLLTCIYLQDTVNAYSKNIFYFGRKYITSRVYKITKEQYENKSNSYEISYPVYKYNLFFQSDLTTLKSLKNKLSEFYVVKNSKTTASQ